ncbi:MAG: anthranilate synthase component I family protein [Leptospiraceae bacterium]|nr:anthranilate synthase component I family protein [Leptospiraceae bacterium]
MKILPDLNYNAIVCREWKTEKEPDWVYPEILKNENYGIWFEVEKTQGGEERKFSCLSINPDFTVTRNSDTKEILLHFPEKNFSERFFCENYFSYLSQIENWIQEIQTKIVIENLSLQNFPFLGGFYGYFGYGLKNEIEFFKKKIPVSQFSDSVLCFFPEVLIFLHSEKKYYFVSMKENSNSDFYKKIQKIFSDRYTFPERKKDFSLTEKTFEELISDYNLSLDQNSYSIAFQKIHESIFSGKIYQACLTAKFEKKYFGNPLEDFFNLKQKSKTPYTSYVCIGDLHILSFSVEKFLSIQESQIISRPVKGTAIRKSIAEDDNLKKKLITSEKEKSENCIIVDLIRNDIGRVSKTGSVKVNKLLEIETHPSVYQLVSEVVSEKKKNCSFSEILKALFPGGSMTGAPKIEVMNLIEEIETCPRGIYSGAIGFWDIRGEVDLNMVIRTAFIYKDKLSFHSGGGIVAESILQNEWEELVGKSEFFMKYFSRKELI